MDEIKISLPDNEVETIAEELAEVKEELAEQQLEETIEDLSLIHI